MHVDQFAEELMPCLDKAVEQGQEARFMTVLAPGTGSPLDEADLGLKKNRKKIDFSNLYFLSGLLG